MSRTIQPLGTRGSLKWIQRAVNDRTNNLDDVVLRHLSDARSIQWLSPLRVDEFAEYRDEAFLHLVGAGDLQNELANFWPRRGPQWDALGRSDTGDILLVEAKAHIAEMLSPATQASEASRAFIEKSLAEVVSALKATPRAPWSTTFFQLANRIAHLWFLRSHGKPAWLVLVGFTNDIEMGGPASSQEWHAAYQVAMHVMGLGAQHPMARYIIHAHPDVREL